jgi:DNA-binding transcriptional LysR family regulator
MYDWAEFRHFRYLLKILEKRGFRPAAEELFTSQPNLTVQARQFQDNASVHLFRKTKSGQIIPTKAGMAFIVLARSLLEFRDEVIDAIVAIEREEINAIRLAERLLAVHARPGLARRVAQRIAQHAPHSIKRCAGDASLQSG